MHDIRGMTVGQVVDFVIAYNDRNKVEKKDEKKKTVKRRASQADIDAFFG